MTRMGREVDNSKNSHMERYLGSLHSLVTAYLRLCSQLSDILSARENESNSRTAVQRCVNRIYPELGSSPSFLRASSSVPKSTLGNGSGPNGMWRFTKPLILTLPFLLVGTNRVVFFGLRGLLDISELAKGGITSSCISSLMICGSRRISIRLDGSEASGWVGAGLAVRFSRATSSSSMIIVGLLGWGSVVGGGFCDSGRRV